MTFRCQDRAGQTAGHTRPPVIYAARESIMMNSDRPRAEAVAVQHRRYRKFLAVGTRAEVQAAAGESAPLDQTFADNIVVAGLVEQHVHPVLAALTMNTKVFSIEDWDAIDGFSPAIRDEKTYQETLAAAIKARQDRSQAFISRGYPSLLSWAAAPIPAGQTGSQLSGDHLASLGARVLPEQRCGKEMGTTEAFPANLAPSQKEQSDFAKGHFYEQGALAVPGRAAATREG